MGTVLEPRATPEHRRRWSREECAFLENSGLLRERYELLDGEIVVKVSQNYPHAAAVMRLIAYALRLVDGEIDRVRTQATMEVREDDRVANRPEPDVVVLRGPVRRVPDGTDVLMAVEVSDTTQGDDFGVKVGLYARAGVVEYWVLDLTRRRLVAFTEPRDGVYTGRAEWDANATAAPTFAPDRPIAVRDLLPAEE